MRRAIWALVLAGCMPDPRSLKEEREAFDRRPIQGTVLLERLPPSSAVGAVFDGRIELAGLTIEPKEPRRGDDVVLIFYWRALKPLSEELMVFVHGDPPPGYARRIHGDHWPAGGAYPTDLWRQGEIIADRFILPIPGDYGPDHLPIFVGLYKGEYRLPLTNPGGVPGDHENRSRPLDLVLGPR